MNILQGLLRLTGHSYFEGIQYHQNIERLSMELPGILNWAVEGYNSIYTDQNEIRSTKWAK